MELEPLATTLVQIGVFVPIFESILAERWPLYREYVDCRRALLLRPLVGCRRRLAFRPTNMVRR